MLAEHVQSAWMRIPRDILVTVGSLVLLASGGAVWHHRLAEKNEFLSVQVDGLERQSKALAGDREDARRLQGHIAARLEITRRMVEQKNAGRWTPALRGIAASAGPNVELRVIHLWKNPDDLLGRILRIEGAASGAQPRLIADQFCRQLQKELRSHFQMNGECHFERLEDVGARPRANPQEPTAAFILVAPVGAPLPATAAAIPKQ